MSSRVNQKKNGITCNVLEMTVCQNSLPYLYGAFQTGAILSLCYLFVVIVRRGCFAFECDCPACWSYQFKSDLNDNQEKITFCCFSATRAMLTKRVPRLKGQKRTFILSCSSTVVSCAFSQLSLQLLIPRAPLKNNF